MFRVNRSADSKIKTGTREDSHIITLIISLRKGSGLQMTLEVLNYSWRCNTEPRYPRISWCVAGIPDVSKSRVALIFKVAGSTTNTIKKEFFINFEPHKDEDDTFLRNVGNHSVAGSYPRIPESWEGS
jgi:hypothetical protein